MTNVGFMWEEILESYVAPRNLNCGIVSGQFVYKPIGQVTLVNTAGYEMLFRSGRVEGSARKVTMIRGSLPTRGCEARLPL